MSAAAQSDLRELLREWYYTGTEHSRGWRSQENVSTHQQKGDCRKVLEQSDGPKSDARRLTELRAKLSDWHREAAACTGAQISEPAWLCSVGGAPEAQSHWRPTARPRFNKTSSCGSFVLSQEVGAPKRKRRKRHAVGGRQGLRRRQTGRGSSGPTYSADLVAGLFAQRAEAQAARRLSGTL
jgi:hypothetical protein